MKDKYINKIIKKSNEVSAKILVDYSNVYYGLDEIFSGLGYETEIVFDELIDLQKFKDEFRQSLVKDCLELDYLHFSPILIDAIAKFYVDKGVFANTILGLALKNVLGFIWSGSYQNGGNNSRSYKSLTNVISKAIFHLIIEQIIKVWEIAPLERVVILSTGVIESEDFANVYNQIQKQGRHQYKVLDQAKELFWNNNQIEKTLDGIINGNIDPRIEFEHSFLGDIPPSDISFWGKIYILMKFYSFCIKSMLAMSNDLEGICIMPESSFQVQTNVPIADFQEVVFNCFWRPEWHKKMINMDFEITQRMIIDRPCIRIRDNENLFATSLVLLRDSINLCMERYIHNNDALYEKFFTKPFENKVISLLINHGFTTGEITLKGVWKTNIENIKLLNNQYMPGQVDIFALDEFNNTAFLIDCKLLHFPLSNRALTNLISKFSEGDGDGFYKKLRNKKKWLNDCEQLRGVEIIDIHVTNVYVPQFNHENLVLTYDQLEAILKDTN